MLNAKVHDCTIRKRLHYYGFFGGGVRRKPLFCKNSTAAQLRFPKLHLNKLKDVWNNVLWTDETRVEMFGHNAEFG